MRKKITLIGAGNIGGTLAHLIALKQLGDITLIDVIQGIPQGKALDLSQSSTIESFNSKINGSNNFSSMKNADVVIVTAGLQRRPEMKRDDLGGKAPDRRDNGLAEKLVLRKKRYEKVLKCMKNIPEIECLIALHETYDIDDINIHEKLEQCEDNKLSDAQLDLFRRINADQRYEVMTYKRLQEEFSF